VFTLLWFGIVAFLLRMHAGFFFPSVFAAFGLLLLFALFDFILGRSTIRAGRDRLVVTRSWLGFVRSRTYPVQQVVSASATVGMTSGGGSGTPYYDVNLGLSSGGRAVAAKYLRSRKDAEVLAAKFLHDCGVAQRVQTGAAGTSSQSGG
jgi:hypothetical protein